jgi:F-type H+-transporting ATPase subunit b
MSLEALAQYSQWVGALVFLIVLIWGFRKFLLPALSTYEQNKNAEIADTEARREKMKADVSAARGEVETASRDAQVMEERAVSDAATERAQIIEAAHEDAARIIRNAEGELGRARLAARAELREELVSKALAAARRTAAARVDTKVNAKLVGDAIDTVVREHAEAAG